MLPELRFLLLILSVGWIGWIGYFLFFGSRPSAKFTDSMTAFLFGFGITSSVLAILTILREFNQAWIVLAIATLVIATLIRLVPCGLQDAIHFGRSVMAYTAWCGLIGILSLCSARFTKPYEAAMLGYDASAYIASAFLLAETGSLSHEDRVVHQTQGPEREIFRSRVGPYYDRIPGGVQVVDISKGISGFTFFPLFSSWLAIGVLLLGPLHFLYVLSFFSTLSLVLFFLIGQRLGSWLLGISLVTSLFFFYPQFFFSRLPLSEILGQALLFSGLWVIASGLRDDGSLNSHSQIIAGVLWGSVLLCRIDLAFFLLLILILLFTAIPNLNRKIYDWKPFFICIGVFLSCMFFWQLSASSYLVIWGLSRSRIVQLLWTPTVGFMSRWLTNHPVMGPLLYFTVSALFLAAISRWIRNRKISIPSRYMSAFGIGIAVGIPFLIMPDRFRWNFLEMSFTRFFLYTPGLLLFFLFTGLGIILYFQIKKLRSTLLWMLVGILVVPTVFYLLRPWNIPSQPIFARRFVPATYPLLFILSFAGWYQLLCVHRERFRVPGKIVFSVLIVGFNVLLFEKVSYLLREPLFENVIPQIRGIKNHLPSNSLVIVPRKDQGFGIEIPLQYLAKQDVLSFPLDAAYNPVIDSFLKRMMGLGTPVKLLLLGSDDSAIQFLRNYHSTLEVHDTLHIRVLPGFEPTSFPDRSVMGDFSYQLFNISNKPEPRAKREIAFDDPDVTFLRFHTVESGFRWSKERSEIRNFLYDLKGQKTDLILSVLPELMNVRKDPKVSLLINDNIAVEASGSESGDYFFRLPLDSVKVITSITVQCKAFVPKDLGINQDTRTLGLPFVRVEFRSGQ